MARAPSWQQGGTESDVSGSVPGSSEDEVAELTQAEAGEEFAQLLIMLKRSATLSAHQACLLADWAHKGGCVGCDGSLVFRPGAHSGYHSRHWDRATNCTVDKGELYALQVPSYSRCAASRCELEIPVILSMRHSVPKPP